MEDNQRADGFYWILFSLFILSLFSLIFLVFFSIKTSLGAIRELISISFIVVLPLIFVKVKLRWKMLSSFVLFFVFTYAGFTLANQGDLELGALVYVPFLLIACLTAVTASHFILRYLRSSQNKTLKITILLFEIGIILICTLFSYVNITNQIKQYNNMNALSEIRCKGAYTTTSPDDLKSSCDKIIEPFQANYWTSVKQHCYDVVQKIKSDKYYFDDQSVLGSADSLRSPINYVACAEGPYALFTKYSSSYGRIPSLIRPEIKDPALCDHLDQSSGTYFDSGRGHVADNCYSRVAIANGNVALCEKTHFPHQCYEYVAEQRKDPSICDNIKIDLAGNINEKYISDCKAQAIR